MINMAINSKDVSGDEKMEFSHFEAAFLIVQALNHRIRQNIVKLFQELPRLTSADICFHLKLDQSAASQQLIILRRANILNSQRDGKLIYYELNHERLAGIWEFVLKVLDEDSNL